jgi:hypothetical protein
MKTVPWFFAVLLAIAASPALSDERPTAEGLLAAYEKSVEQLARARIECLEKQPERQLGENGSIAETHERTIIRNGPQWKVADVIRTIRTTNGTKQEGGLRAEMIVAEQLLEVLRTIDGTVQVSAWLDPTTVKKTQVGTQVLTIDPARIHWRMLGGAETLFGRFPGDADQPLWEVMREAATLSLLPDTEEIDGAATYVLKSQGKFGEHTVWIDPARGSLPRRIEIRKELGNLLNSNQLGSRIGLADEKQRQPGRGPPSTQPPDIRAFSARIGSIQIENKGGVFVMTAWKVESKTTFGNGAPGEHRTENSVTVVDFKPEASSKDAFRPGIEIPEKSGVRVQDGLPGTEYEWVGGKVQIRGGN